MPKHTKKDAGGVVEPNVGTDELEAALRRSKESDGETVRLVAVTMKEHNKIQIPVARGFKFEDIPALGISPEVPKDWGEKMVEARRLNSANVRPAVVWHLEPPSRPRNPEKKFFERDGRRFYTDVYAPPKGTVINGRPIYHSVSQSIHFISRVLRTVPGIQRWITDYDTRPEVAAWGNYVIQQREQDERDALGVSGGTQAMV